MEDTFSFEMVKNYRHRIEEYLAKWMPRELTSRSVDVNSSLTKIWCKLVDMECKMSDQNSHLTEHEAESWCNAMVNDDGTKGPHWTKEQTTSVAETMQVAWGKFTPTDFWVTMNMMYSDYRKSAVIANKNTPEFFAGLATEFLMDTDAPEAGKKLARYYRFVVQD